MASKPLALGAISLLLIPAVAQAHFFGTVYRLPIPFWMYAYGASAALIVSFALVAYFVSTPVAVASFKTLDLTHSPLASTLRRTRFGNVVRATTVFTFTVAILTGLYGNPNPFDNFCMSFFWIAFALALTYLSALVSDASALMNPWQVMIAWLGRFRPASFSGRLAFPAWLGYWPGLGLYALYIWIELFGHTQPRSLAMILISYTVITVSGAWLFGSRSWLCHGEIFSIGLKLIGKMAPVRCAPLQMRWPFIGLIRAHADRASLVIFILFMLSSTAFDGAHETLPWISLFWKGVYPVIGPLVARLSPRPYETAASLYYAWQWAMLVASPFIYYAIYLVFISLTRRITKTDLTVQELSLRFAFSLIPIAFVYNVSHYYTLLITEAPRLLAFLSDPFGNGWNLFGTRGLSTVTVVPSAGFVWHSQVWLILAGHIVSVWTAHMQALQIFATSRQATLSQLPMLVLMVAFTAIGLWILSLPIAPG